MRMRLSIVLLSTMFVLSISVLTSCSSSLTPQLFREGHSESLLEQLEHETSAAGDHTTEALPLLENSSLLDEVDAVQVQALVHDQPFRTLARAGQITQYPCSSCHVEPLADLQAAQSSAAPQAHWDIAIDHADERVMSCTTCHSPDNMDTLHTVTDEPIDFDHSYQLCAQCHSGVADDWVGGAHGKRVGGWAPPRVVNNCVDCHNPHQPQWDTRWPAVTSGGID